MVAMGGPSLAMSFYLLDLNGASVSPACMVLKLDLESAFHLFADTTQMVRHQVRQAK